jgi:hypothetical protein
LRGFLPVWTRQEASLYNRAAFGGVLPGDAQVAQLVEHAIENRSVAGSIPALGTIAFK